MLEANPDDQIEQRDHYLRPPIGLRRRARRGGPAPERLRERLRFACLMPFNEIVGGRPFTGVGPGPSRRVPAAMEGDGGAPVGNST